MCHLSTLHVLCVRLPHPKVLENTRGSWLEVSLFTSGERSYPPLTIFRPRPGASHPQVAEQAFHIVILS